MLAGAVGPDDLARLSDEQLEPLLDSASDATLGDEQAELILRKVGSKLDAAELRVGANVGAAGYVRRACAAGPGIARARLFGRCHTFRRQLHADALDVAGGCYRPGVWRGAGGTRHSPAQCRANGGQVAADGKTEMAVPSPPAPAAAAPSPSPVVATITKMVDCRCAADCPAPRLRDCVEVGRQFDLEAGLLEITYDTGARVILHGPVSYKVRSNNSGFLAYGDLTGVVEKTAGTDIMAAEEHDLFGCRPPVPDPPQFTVRTPEADVTDLRHGIRRSRGPCWPHGIARLPRPSESWHRDQWRGRGGQRDTRSC